MKAWPSDGSMVAFEEIVDPIVQSIRFFYSTEPKFDLDDESCDNLQIPWNSYNIGRDALAVCFPPDVRLTAKMLRKAQERGRDPLVEMISLAVQVGMEQGKRNALDGVELSTLRAQAKLGEIFMREMEREASASKTGE